MTEYAYHCSPNGDIKEFIPQVSSHGKAYVYATPNKSLYECKLFYILYFILS